MFKLARSTGLRPVTTLLGAFSHTRLRLVRPYRALARLRLARLCVEKKNQECRPTLPIFNFFKLSTVQSQKKFYERLHFFKFVYIYWILLYSWLATNWLPVSWLLVHWLPTGFSWLLVGWLPIGFYSWLYQLVGY